MLVACQNSEMENYIFFDLETSSAGRRSEILQIGAIDLLNDDKQFNINITPNGSINPFASKVNGFTVTPGKVCVGSKVYRFVGTPGKVKFMGDHN